jgi:hypothetical protein
LPTPFDFEAFNLLPKPFRGIASLPSRMMWWLFPIFLILIVTVCSLTGTLGTLKDLQARSDVERALNIGDPSPSPISFPLWRDFPSGLFLVGIVATTYLVHKQWNLFRTVIAELEQSGALIRKEELEFSLGHRLVGLPWFQKDDVTQSIGYEGFMNRLNRWMDSLSYLFFVNVIIAGLLAFLFISSEERLGLFRILADSSAPHGETVRFAQSAYENWWGSKDNLPGNVAGGFIVAFAMLIITLQNVAGLAAVYLIGSLRAFFAFSADWYNGDRNYGWMPLTRAYRTVRFSLMIHAAMLSLVLLVVDFSAWKWNVLLFLIWLGAVVLYGPIPWFVFRCTQDSATDLLVSRVKAESSSLTQGERLEGAEILRRQVGAVRIRPLSRSRDWRWAFFVTVGLPLLLSAAQIFSTFVASTGK